jgi:hypothetical protein
MSKPQEILILINELNNRSLFLFRHVFSKILGIRPIITNDKDAFIQCTTAKLNYTKNRIGDGLYVKPSGLIYQKGFKQIDVKVTKIDEMPVIFASGEDSDMPFDIFSAIFYMLVRYEEYKNFTPDRHGRFQARESTFYSLGYHQEPIVDIWIDYLKGFLKQRFEHFEYTKHNFQYLPTIDIDNAFAYKNKGVIRTTLALIRDLFTGKIGDFFYRCKVLLRMKDDPFETYQYLEQQLKGYQNKPVFFFLAGKKSKYDTNVSFSRSAMIDVVKASSKYTDIGIHPSYASNRKNSLLDKEKARLDAINGQPVTKSRQHFLKMRMPTTYQNLIKIGILEDYSMGYAASIGFRAGTCHPFNFYDITRDKETELRIVPFQAMDATFKTYIKTSPEESLQKMLELKEKIKKHGGTLCIVWHNETFAPTKEGLEWRKVFEKMLQEN